MNQLTSLSVPVGSSNDCICTSSSLTTPPVPSLTTALVTTRGTRNASNGLDATAADAMPPRRIAIASISSMKPIAPPSVRAALRSALKYARIFFAVAP